MTGRGRLVSDTEAFVRRALSSLGQEADDETITAVAAKIIRALPKPTAPMSPNPKRIQRKREKGWRMPDCAVYVGRPSRWGNPYYPGSGVGYGYFDEQMRMRRENVEDPRVQISWFRQHVTDMRAYMPAQFETFIAPLRGKDLACWCRLDAPCHGDVLLELANTPLPAPVSAGTQRP